MARIGHGGPVATSDASRMTSRALLSGELTSRFGAFFPDLFDAASRLETSPQTHAALIALANTMTDEASDKPETAIPTAYTYLGQFIDHDLTLDERAESGELLDNPDLQPIDLTQLRNRKNLRTARLDLDSVYRDATVVPLMQRASHSPVPLLDPTNPNLFLIGPTTSPAPQSRPPGASPLNDLPRRPPSSTPETDREAMIGDPRNDENTIVAQLHVAFLKAHNALVRQGRTFDAAKRALTDLYQAIVLFDYLPRICDPDIVADVLKNRPAATIDSDLMPAEFSGAAFRFGHSMIRREYDFNLHFEQATLQQLFVFTALSGNSFGTPTLPENWIIQWPRLAPLLFGRAPQMTMAIDTRLTEFTRKLQNVEGKPHPKGSIAGVLAQRNLLRGYLLGLPTAQAVISAYNSALPPERMLPQLDAKALLASLPTDAMRTAAEPFKDKTPLWFYILAEAGDPNGASGRHLGQLGSRLVAETLFHKVASDPNGILNRGSLPRSLRRAQLKDLLWLSLESERGAGQ